MTDKEYEQLLDLRVKVEEMMNGEKIEKAVKTDETSKNQLRMRVVYDRINKMIQQHEKGTK